MVLIGAGPGRSWRSLDKAHQTLANPASVATARRFPQEIRQTADRSGVTCEDLGTGSRRAPHMLGLPTTGGTASSTGGGIPGGLPPPTVPPTVGSRIGMRGAFSTSFFVSSSDMSGD